MTEGRQVLTIRAVSKTYDSGNTHALDDVSLAVGDGEFVALVGPSGCGKSTLLNLIAGLDTPDTGEILVDGQALDAEQRLARFGYMPQEDLLFPWRSVLDNVSLGLEVQGLPRGTARERALAQFETFGLAGFEDRRPRELSGGMRQRAAFLRTVLLDRPFLLLDEPFGALDAITRAQLQTWLSEMLAEMWAQSRGSALLVTHDPQEAVTLADRVYLMSPRPGRITSVIDVDLPRPRSEAATTSEHAHRLIDELRRQAEQTALAP